MVCAFPKLISKCKNIVSCTYDFANTSVQNSHTFLSVWFFELGIEDGMILKKIIALFILKILESKLDRVVSGINMLPIQSPKNILEKLECTKHICYEVLHLDPSPKTQAFLFYHLPCAVYLSLVSDNTSIHSKNKPNIWLRQPKISWTLFTEFTVSNQNVHRHCQNNHGYYFECSRRWVEVHWHIHNTHLQEHS